MDPKLLSLAPTDTLDPAKDPDFKAYHDHLTAVFNDDSLRNIAMIGNRGSGKSSILRSFDARRHNGQSRFLYISLTDFEGSAEQTDEDPEQTRKRLEYSLLCQILARCTADDLKNSTLKGIPEVRKKENRFWRYAWFLLTGLLIFGLLFEDRFGALLIGWGMPGIWRVELHALGYVVAFLSLAGGFLWLRRKRPELVHIGKLTIKTPNADAELTPGSDKYCLDQFKFELIYILNQIAGKIGCTVVFEDMERIRDKAVCARIMTRLRELNALTNTHRSAQTHHAHTPIRFVYAVSDELFDHEERTKFFDTIVPVVPVVNATNSREMLENMLHDCGVLVTDDDIQELLGIVSPCLTDYRTMRNVITEFDFLRRRRKNTSGEYPGSAVNGWLLALCVYKSLFPKEYHAAFAEGGNAVLNVPDVKKHPAAFVEMARTLIEKHWLDHITMELVGYSATQIMGHWRSTLLSGDSQAQYSLLFRFSDPETKKTSDGELFLKVLNRAVRFDGLLEKTDDSGVASLIGRCLYKNAEHAVEYVIVSLVSCETWTEKALLALLATLPIQDKMELDKAVQKYHQKIFEACTLALEKYQRPVYTSEVPGILWARKTEDPAMIALCMLLGDQRNDLPEHLLDRQLGTKTLRDHIAEFNENNPEPAEEPTPT